MPGEILMSVWHAAYAKDGGTKSSGVKKELVRAITGMFSERLNIHFSDKEFDAKFPEDTLDFGAYVRYVKNQILVGKGEQFDDQLDSIELICWSACVMMYQPKMLYFEEDKQNLWQIFNRLTLEGSYPPVAPKQQALWLLERMAEQLGQTNSGYSSVPESGVTFQEMLDILEKYNFTSLSLTTQIHDAILDIHEFIVSKVLGGGYMYKRTRKQSNWTGWLKRWFIFTPGLLTYYESDNCKVKKGEVVVDGKTKLESLGNFSSMRRKLTGRLRLTNSPNLEIEMATGNDKEKEIWLNALRQMVSAACEGTDPVQKVLQTVQTATPKVLVPRATVRKQKTNLATQALSGAQPLSPSSFQPERKYERIGNMVLQPVLANETETIRKMSEADVSGANAGVQQLSIDPDEDFDNNFLALQRDKIWAIFNKIDTNGNGVIDGDEFSKFVSRGLGLRIDNRETDLLFKIVDKDNAGTITFDEFYDYFVHFVLDQSTGDDETPTESKLRSAFIKADRDGTGTVDFREFSDFMLSRQRSITLNKLMESFDDMDKDDNGQVTYTQFRKFVTQAGPLARGSTKKGPAVEEQLKELYDDADVEGLGKYLRQRWTAFASFKRYGATGDLVMSGDQGMVADVVPGEYNLIDLACFSDLPPIVPKHIEVRGVQWNSSGIPGKSGKCVFPENFDGKCPIEIATNEHLAYYGCSIADRNQLKVSLLYRHGIQDFTYENDYLEKYVTSADAHGGAGIEHHEFTHLDCPLEDNSGHFLIGKFVDGVLHLTGFKVPTRHTIYVPGGTIHCNDYLIGTWRTMLSDEAEINHCHLVRGRRKGNVTEMEHFSFKFY